MPGVWTDSVGYLDAETDKLTCQTVGSVRFDTIDPLDTHSRHERTSGILYRVANYLNYAKFSCLHRLFLSAITVHVEPRNYAKAAEDHRWRETMRKEIDALKANNTWYVEVLPNGKRPIDCKCVF